MLWMLKKINHWVHKKEPLHTEEDVVLVMKACTACSIYNLESVCSTTVFGHITFIMLAEQLLSCSVLEAQKRLYGLCNHPPSSCISAGLKGCIACVHRMGCYSESVLQKSFFFWLQYVLDGGLWQYLRQYQYEQCVVEMQVMA